MCGLYGGVSSFLSSQEIDDVMSLAYLSRFRGKDATGIALINKKKENDKKLQWSLMKETVPAGFFVDHPETEKFIKDHPKPLVILGHTRAATTGALTKVNAQPFVHGHIIGAHNGILDAYKESAVEELSDSNNFFKFLSEEGLEEALKKAYKSYNCAFALSWINMKEKTLHLLRNKDRPLWRATGNGTVLWASDPSYLEFMNKRSTIVYGNPISLAENTEYRLNLVTKVWTTHPIELKPIPLVKAGFSNSYPERAWDWSYPSSYVPPWEKDKEERKALLNKRRSERQLNIKKPENHHVIVLDVSSKERNFSIKDDSEKKYTYFGYKGKTFSLDEIRPLLDKGCYACPNIAMPQEEVYWRDDEHYLCKECHGSPIMREIESGITPYHQLFSKSFVKVALNK